MTYTHMIFRQRESATIIGRALTLPSGKALLLYPFMTSEVDPTHK